MYIDVYFLINLILDWCSLKFALQRYKVSKWRLRMGAAVGAAGACLWEMLELSEMPWTAARKTVDESAGRIVWIQFFLCGHTSLCKPFYAFVDRFYTLEL